MFKTDSTVHAQHFVKFFRLEKMDEFQGIATGVAAAEEVDHDGEILDYFASKPYFQKWSDSQKQNSGGKSLGNVRLQHDPSKPVGRLLNLDFDDSNRVVRVTAKIEEPVAKQLLETGVLTGFSIGGDYLKKTPLPNGTVRYVAGPSEVSVCDRPCAPSAVFSVVKVNGETVMRKFAKESTDMEDTKKSILLKAIRAKLFPFTNPELEFEAVEAESAKVWVEDRLIKVGFKADAQGGFDITSTARVSKADLRKDQANDGMPMTVAEERAETIRNGAQAMNRNMVLTQPVQEEFATPPAVNPHLENGEPTPEDPCKIKDAAHSAAVAAVAAPSVYDKAEAVANMEKIEAGIPSLETLQKQLDELKKAAAKIFEEEEFGKVEGETEMTDAQKERIAKARKTVQSHLGAITDALNAHKNAHDNLHKAHDAMHAAYGAAHQAHKAAFDARAVHKAAVDAFHTKAQGGIAEIQKVLGGGPESFGEFNEPDTLNVGPEGTSAGNSQAPGYAATVPATAGLAAPSVYGKSVSAEEVQKMVADGIKAGMAELIKALKPEAAAVPVAAEPTPAASSEGLTKADAAKLITDGIKTGLTEFMKAIIGSEAPAATPAGPGNRDARRPFSKTEDGNGSPEAIAKTEMTEKDWADYRLGKQSAVRKAQACTSLKWTEVPARILARQGRS